MAALDRVRTSFGAFRKSRYFRPAYLFGLALVLFALFPTLLSPAFCLVFLLMPVTMFVVPYWLGERKARRFALNGLVVFAVAVLLVGVYQAQTVLSAPASVLTSSGVEGVHPTMALANGTVEPRNAPAPATFTFRVFLRTTENGTPDDFRVWTDIVVIQGIVGANVSFRMSPLPGLNNTREGVWFEVNRTLDTAVYYYGFSVANNDANWTWTFRDFAPFTTGWPAYYLFFLYLGVAYLLYPLVFYYFFVFMWFYTVRMRESRKRAMERGGLGAAPEPTKVAKPSGGTRKAAAFTCTACGADVEDTDAKCPKCGAVFED